VTSFTQQNDRERILEAIDLVSLIGEHVSLRQKGREHVGLCPFHDDHSPSLHVVTHKGTPFYKCFSCGESGTAIDFVINYHKMPFIDALRFLAQRSGIELSRRDEPSRDRRSDGLSHRDLLDANAFALNYFRNVYRHAEAGEAARRAVEARGISPEMVERFGVGAAPARWDGLITYVRQKGGNLKAFEAAGLLKQRSAGGGTRDQFVKRLIFPICDQLGRAVAFGGRVLDPDDKPKYLNSPESDVFHKSKVIFGLHLARKAISDANAAIIAEGYTDVVALHQAGFENAVATLGTALTREHAKILQRLCDSVILLFDGDEAGQRAADRAVEVFFAQPIDVKICILPGGVDPDDLLRAPDGKVQLAGLLEHAEDALSFLIRQFKERVGATDSISGRQKLAEAMLARLGDLGLGEMSGIRKRMVLPEVAHLLGVGVEEIARLMPRRRAKAAPGAVSGDESSTASPELIEPMAPLAPRNRRKAERDLLSILLYEPSVRNEPVDAGDGHMLPLVEAFHAESFLDGTCRAIFEAVLPWLEDDRDFSVPLVQERLGTPEQRRLASDLYFEGERLCLGSEVNAPQRLREAAAGFGRVRDRELHRERIDGIRQEAMNPNPAGRAPAFVRILEERRLHGDDLTVKPRGVRS